MSPEKLYTVWYRVPARLRTYTQLRREGLRPRRGQEPVAKFRGMHGHYPLYDRSEAEPIRSAQQ